MAWVLLISAACELENTDAPLEKNIYAITDKAEYAASDQIIYSLRNLTDSAAYFYVCSGKTTVQANVEMKNSESWKVIYSPICDGYRSYCCARFEKLESLTDTLIIADFATGVYRLSFGFTIKNTKGDYTELVIRSPEFRVK